MEIRMLICKSDTQIKQILFWLTIVMVTFVLLFIPQMSPAKPKPTENPILFKELPPFEIDKGQVLYQRFCSYCHGETGKGDGPNSFSLSSKPADLTIIQTFPDDKMKTVETILKTGGKGVAKSNEMPAFGNTLSQQQMDAVIRFLRRSSIQ
jgi:cytochrome c5